MAERDFDIHHYKKVRSSEVIPTDNYNRMSENKKSWTSQCFRERDVNNATDPYPWLGVDDPKCYQICSEILYEKIDLSKPCLTSREKSQLMRMILKYRDALSLCDEIGACLNLKADIQVIDESPFFVRPFPLSENDKSFMDE